MKIIIIFFKLVVNPRVELIIMYLRRFFKNDGANIYPQLDLTKKN